MAYSEDLVNSSLELMCKNVEILRNARPSWLVNPETGFKLEYDFFMPKHGLALEIQGPFHFDNIPQQRRDIIKSKISKEHGIVLIELTLKRIRPIDIYRKLRKFSIKSKIKLKLRPPEHKPEKWAKIQRELDAYLSNLVLKYGDHSCISENSTFLRNTRDSINSDSEENVLVNKGLACSNFIKYRDKKNGNIKKAKIIKIKISSVVCHAIGKPNIFIKVKKTDILNPF